MISWYREGKFPIDKVIKFFKVRTARSKNQLIQRSDYFFAMEVDSLEHALHEMHSGATVKPVLVW
jgi:Zn-dependent alcohol dehydrogenase